MADFMKAFQITITENEGAYNPGIGEKETYKGIDRGANPDWSGWIILDTIKKANPELTTCRMNLLLAQNITLQSNIQKFYRTDYWDVIALDKVNDQQLADNLFDCSVNQGPELAGKFMQTACNYTISVGTLPLKPLVIDSKIGSVTLEAFNNLPAAKLNTEINAEREASYRRDNSYAEWGKIWERRLKKYI